MIWHQRDPGRNGLKVHDQPHQMLDSGPGDRIMVTQTGLRVPGRLRYEDWELAGRRLSSLVNASAWCLGDWVIFGQDRYGDRYRRAVEAAGLDYQTIRNYAWVARRFPPTRRLAAVSFQHHAEVAALPADEQDRWLALCAEHHWSRNELRRQLRARRNSGSGNVPALTLPRLNIPTEQVTRWRAAALERNTSLESWMIEQLDTAAAEILGQTG
jgi:hypothetical protein